ncbi:class I SAM-dependent methyltransferase [Fictibacillus enclensis]|uniref:class I SAM-dependent methyltransferase n=1 Tax=Fictibacillus enclensis TaxID=1017270 RepID=UPI0024C0C119|nr:class I SAM-dependent methyltransferase [Fictibacillus enclensis]WHY73823.1 methyltransferase domain-containing protein [Fictibacillus enclensis]
MGRTTDVWNAYLYDTKHSFVSKYGGSLIELLAPQPGEKILDLGCGTGDLAQKIHDMQADVTGVDQSPNMIKQAEAKFPDINFLVKDATRLDFSNEFHAVFSNATLHWVKLPEKALQGIYHSLKKGGRFVAEFGGKGNVQTITDEIIRQIRMRDLPFKNEQFPWYYPSIAEYSKLMEAVGFRVTFAQHYDRPTPLEGDHGLRNWLEMFACGFFTGLDEEVKISIISDAEARLRDVLYIEGTWVADYKRIRVVGTKE